MTGASTGRGRRAAPKWWQGLLGGMILMLSPATAFLVAVLSAPAVLMAVADTSPKRALTRTVALFSLAGAIGPLRAFFLAGHDLEAAFGILARPSVVLLVWLSGGCGWLLDEVLCLVASLLTSLRHASHRSALEARLLEIRKEWEIEDPGSAS